MFSIICPLCTSQETSLFYSAQEKVHGTYFQKDYFSCSQCSLVFLDPKLRLSSESEKKRYSEHINLATDEGYCRFLLKSWEPLQEKLTTDDIGLDYGCGPNPVLSQLLVSKGYNVDTYDPFFKPMEPNGQYDYILCTEVIEHVYDLNKFLTTVTGLLKRRAYLSVMTEFLTSQINFKNWKYRQDMTHVCFFSKEVFSYISEKYFLEIDFDDGERVIVFRKL